MSDRKSTVWEPEWSSTDRQKIDELVKQIGARVSALQALRKQLGLSQAELAKILQTTQSNVSKLESSREVRLGALKTLVESQGGHLKVVAEFNGREIELAV